MLGHPTTLIKRRCKLAVTCARSLRHGSLLRACKRLARTLPGCYAIYLPPMCSLSFILSIMLSLPPLLVVSELLCPCGPPVAPPVFAAVLSLVLSARSSVCLTHSCKHDSRCSLTVTLSSGRADLITLRFAPWWIVWHYFALTPVLLAKLLATSSRNSAWILSLGFILRGRLL